ncbi:MAG TPA: MFS transporter [Gaiellaceae bacterium]|nr:MFS transporter [Gaiellaceae bacterium]
MISLPPAFHHLDFRRLWISLVCSGMAMQMAQVAIGWQVYAIHHKAFDLGLIGLVEFVPVPFLALYAGSLADRLPRVTILMVVGVAEAGVLALLLLVTLGGANQLWEFLALAALTGAISALSAPAGRSLVPEIVPSELLAGAIALRSVSGQVGTIGGPALGGLLFAVRPEAVYGVGAALLLLSSAVLIPVTRPEAVPPASTQPPRLETLLAGIRFIRGTPIILGAITLDLFAVLFGGAVALLPLYAKSILHTGPFGLGVLRSTVAVGALIAGIQLARRPLKHHAGRTLLTVVGLFGLCMIVFGLSRWFWLSALALAVSGYVDMFSMNIRSTTVALATPNQVLGRVSAVENVFIGASNELGAFESGAAAALLGAVPAVVAGGALTVGLALVWPKVFPALSRVDEMSAAGLREVLPVGGRRPASAPEPAD